VGTLFENPSLEPFYQQGQRAQQPQEDAELPEGYPGGDPDQCADGEDAEEEGGYHAAYCHCVEANLVEEAKANIRRQDHRDAHQEAQPDRLICRISSEKESGNRQAGPAQSGERGERLDNAEQDGVLYPRGGSGSRGPARISLHQTSYYQQDANDYRYGTCGNLFLVQTE